MKPALYYVPQGAHHPCGPQAVFSSLARSSEAPVLPFSPLHFDETRSRYLRLTLPRFLFKNAQCRQHNGPGLRALSLHRCYSSYRSEVSQDAFLFIDSPGVLRAA